MLHASTQKLILKISELTDAGLIAWKEGEGERPCSVFESEGYVVEVTADPPTVRLLRADGRELERADAAELSSAPWPGGDGTFATRVSSMASRAHRVARGAEAAISRILSSLSAPPQRAPEPEPPPAAPEFETMAPPRAQSTRAAESEAAMAAIAADMESLRRDARPEPLPQSHAAPEAAPETTPSAPEPPPWSASPQTLLTSTAPATPAAAEPEAPVAPVVVQPDLAAPVIEPAPEPSPPPIATTSPITERPPVQAAPKPVPRPQGAFGATASFSQSMRTPPKSEPKPAPHPAIITPKLTPTKVTSGGLVFSGISAVTRQTVHGEPTSEPAKPAPSLEPKPEPKLEPAKLNGVDVYKPWG